MSSKHDEEEIEIDGVLYSYRCDICWQELDETDIQFKPCNRCHLQVCLFCFNKHTNRKESYSKSCPKCREPIDMEQIMKQNMNNASKTRHTLAKKLLSKKSATNTANTGPHKKRKRKKCGNKETATYSDHNHSHIDIDEEVPKTDWKNYLKGRFISRDSIIVAPVIAKFNNEEAISDNFKAYGRITRINMWDDESAHIMYDKQYFADALVDKIQDIAVRYQGQFGLMSAKYHFRRPCEEFMDPDRRCPMQCRKFHGPYYKLDFIPLEQYLDEETREQWIQERKKHVSGIVKARYKKFRKKFMDGIALPIGEKHKDEYNGEYDEENGHYGYDYYGGNGNGNGNGYNGRYRHTPRYMHNNNNNNKQHAHVHAQSVNIASKHAITLKYNNMGKANKLLALDDSLRQHMRLKPNQPLPPSRPPPLPPQPQSQPQPQPHPQPHCNGRNANANANALHDDGGHSVCTESTSTSASTIGSGRRTRPPIHHTTSAQIGQFMATDPTLNINVQFNGEDRSKNNKVAALLAMHKMQRAKSETDIVQLNGDAEMDDYYAAKGTHSASSSQLHRNTKRENHQYSQSTSNLRTLKTVDLLKSLKKKKRKERNAMVHCCKPQTTSSIAKKSKLNANAASYKPLSLNSKYKLENDHDHDHDQNETEKQNKYINYNGILKKESDLNICDYVYDFGAALDAIHNEKQGQTRPHKMNVSSDDSSDDEYNYNEKWTEYTLWNKVRDIMNAQEKKMKINDISWQNIRKLLKGSMTFADWNYVKEMKFVKKMKAKWRIEFKMNDLHEHMGTKEAQSFSNLVYNECSVIDLDLRITDIGNYMTDLLTQNAMRQASQYDTRIIAELGQIRSVYQKWIEDKKLRKEENQDAHQEEEHLFGVPININHGVPVVSNNNNNSNKNGGESDFYSRLLVEIQQQSKEFDDELHEHDNPKDLVMDYIGINQDNDDKKQEMDEEYDYEYSDIEEDDDHKENGDEDALYQYDDDEVDDDNDDENENGIFSRCHSPPPRHRNNGNNNNKEDEKEREQEDIIHMNANVNVNANANANANANGGNLINDAHANDECDRHYYNARYPPRRGRYHYQRYGAKNNQNILNNSVKMEWKKKEKEQENKEIENLNENHEENENNNDENKTIQIED